MPETKRKRLTETKKNQHNLKKILLHSNANPIKNRYDLGYGCLFCTEIFPETKLLKEHFLKTHKVMELCKAINSKLFQYFIKLDITDLKCASCDKRINELNEFIDHIQAEHNVDVYKDVKSAIVPFKFETNEFKCIECDKEFLKFKHLLEHMGVHFSNYVCPVCGVGCVTDRLYSRHVKRHETEYSESKCNDCDKVFGNREKLRDHQKRIHMGLKKRKKCYMCGERFLHYAQKLDHMVRIHGVAARVLKCHICEKTFRDVALLNIHVKRDHLLERTHKCGECEMAFFNATRLKHHVLARHANVKQYECDLCSKTYALRGPLRKHIMRVHANI